jgi:D-methionine transport system ATP-binding protein
LPAGNSELVRWDAVTKVFEGGGGRVTALDAVTLGVNRGEILGILGRSGAGKSTLIRTVNHLEVPTGGHVWFDGTDVGALDRKGLKALRRRVGMIFQHFALVGSVTVAQNIALPLRLHGLSRKETSARVARFLDLVGLTDKAKAYPAQLSGGQKQRVAIARALALEPDLLLSDEGTSALDPETKESILDLLKHINQTLGITIVLITHELSVVQRVADRIAVMKDGQVIEQGPLVQVFTKPVHPFTKSLLKGFWHDQVGEVVDQAVGPGRRFVLSYSGAGSTEPALAELAQKFGLKPNILGGLVTTLAGQPFGRLVIQLDGNVEPALAHLRSKGIDVEEASDGAVAR